MTQAAPVMDRLEHNPRRASHAALPLAPISPL